VRFPGSLDRGPVLGILGLRSSRRGLAIAGIVLVGLTLLAAAGNAALGASLGLTGDLFSRLR
jgi:hypothetical protein